MLKNQASVITGKPLIPLFSLGELYMSDFVRDGDSSGIKVPLSLALDPVSGLLQLEQFASPDKMYTEYWYRSGVNSTMVAELKSIAEKAVSLIKCEKGDTVLDIGSNDGTLLKYYDKELYRIGIDPAENLAKYAREYSDTIIVDYFTAEAYYSKCQQLAKIITTIAMFYDLENPHTFLNNINAVLDNEGLWIIQMSYMPLMLQQYAFDNICHEHYEYYSLTSFRYLIEQHNMKIVGVELNDINGGSFRIYVRKQSSKDETFSTAPYRDVCQFNVNSILEYEKKLSLDNPRTYIKWFTDLVRIKDKTMKFIEGIKSEGKTIWGYGASTKGNTLLQWYGLDHTLIDAIAERNPLKYGRKTVGTDIVIKSEIDMRKAMPDYLIILPWHFISEFKQREKEYLNQGGKFIVPLPDSVVISSEGQERL